MPTLALRYYVEADLSLSSRHTRPIAWSDLTNQRVSLQKFKTEFVTYPKSKPS